MAYISSTATGSASSRPVPAISAPPVNEEVHSPTEEVEKNFENGRVAAVMRSETVVVDGTDAPFDVPFGVRFGVPFDTKLTRLGHMPRALPAQRLVGVSKPLFQEWMAC